MTIPECPTCGGKKKDHSDRLWAIHKKMHENATKARRVTERYVSMYAKQRKKAEK